MPSCPPGVGNTRPGFAATPHPSREPLRVLFCQGAARSAFSWGKRFFRTGGDAATASAPGSLWFGSFAPLDAQTRSLCVPSCPPGEPESFSRLFPMPLSFREAKNCLYSGRPQCYSPECNPV